MKYWTERPAAGVTGAVAGALLLWAAAALGAGKTDCSKIEDAAERLACYDRQFRRQEREDVRDPVPVVAPQPVPAPPPPDVVSGGAADEASAPEPAAAQRDGAAAGKPPARETTFLGDEKVDLSSTIKAILAGEKQKMVFQLDNNQIWIQATPRPLPFREGDRVTIRNALLGGYFMRSEKGLSTRVQRIH